MNTTQAKKPLAPGDLVIAETETSTWNYHIRRIEADGLFLGGGAPPALCGAKVGWDTLIPLSTYGSKDGLSHWCPKCLKIATT